MVFDVKLDERQHNFAQTRSDDLVLFILVVVIVFRVVWRADCAAGSFKNVFVRVST